MLRRVRTVCFIGLIGCAAVALAQSRWDSSFKRVCHVTVDSGTQVLCTTSAAGKYVMTDCNGNDTNVGFGKYVTVDAGVDKPCLLLDAGVACEKVYSSKGEKQRGQMLPLENRVVLYSPSGVSTCDVYEGQ